MRAIIICSWRLIVGAMNLKGWTGGAGTRPTPLGSLATVIAVLAAVPVLAVFVAVLSGGTGNTWSHLASTVLGEYIGNTMILCVSVGLGVASIGVTTGWLASDYWFPDVRTVGGAVAMFTFVLYPYVYMLARTAFLERASGILEAGHSLGLGPWAAFFRLSLPLARPALVAGTALALMETLADYGTVSYFAVQTFTTGIYRAWFSLGDRQAAAQLSAALLSFVVLVLVLERYSRGRARFHNTSRQHRAHGSQRLGPAARWVACLACTMPLCLGFFLPGGLLLRMALTEGDAQFGERFLHLARNSFVLASATALLAMVLAVLLAYAVRLSRARLFHALNRLVGLGYAMPGSVIAVGVLIPVTRLDNWLAQIIAHVWGANPGLLLTGGIAALVYAYLTRFLSVALQTVETGLSKITASMDDAARSLGAGRWASLARVHVPIMRGSLLTATLLVFVDVMKELPATLVMRPFNFDTLATQAYTLASDERLAEASTSALTIVLVGLLPMIVLSRQIARQRSSR